MAQLFHMATPKWKEGWECVIQLLQLLVEMSEGRWSLEIGIGFANEQ